MEKQRDRVIGQMERQIDWIDGERVIGQMERQRYRVIGQMERQRDRERQSYWIVGEIEIGQMERQRDRVIGQREKQRQIDWIDGEIEMNKQNHMVLFMNKQNNMVQVGRARVPILPRVKFEGQRGFGWTDMVCSYCIAVQVTELRHELMTVWFNQTPLTQLYLEGGWVAHAPITASGIVT